MHASETSLMLDLAAQLDGMAATIRRFYALSDAPTPATWTADAAQDTARKVKSDLGSAQKFAIRRLAEAYPQGLPAADLAVNPNSMPNTYQLLDKKLGPVGLVRCDNGYPRKYYLGPAFDRQDASVERAD
jgi:hypothetical protein